MSIKERVKKIWNDNKGVICLTTGVVLTVATYVIVKRNSNESAPGSHTFVPVEDLSFPGDMPVAEIKKALQNDEGITFIQDALIVGRETGSRMYVRDAAF